MKPRGSQPPFTPRKYLSSLVQLSAVHPTEGEKLTIHKVNALEIFVSDLSRGYVVGRK